MKKILIMSIIMILISFNAFAFGDKTKDAIEKIGDPDCVCAFYIGANLGTGDLNKQMILDEMFLYASSSDTYDKCYEIGLIYNLIGVDISLNKLLETVK